MASLSLCTVVLEYNYQADPALALGSVWLFAGDASQFLEEPDEALAEVPGWTKIAGPIDLEIASAIQSALVHFLRDNGVFVIDEGIAD